MAITHNVILHCVDDVLDNGIEKHRIGVLRQNYCFIENIIE